MDLQIRYAALKNLEEDLKNLLEKIKQISEINNKKDKEKITSLRNNVQFEITTIEDQALKDKTLLENIGSIKRSDIIRCRRECDSIKNLYEEYCEIKFKIFTGDFSKLGIDWIYELEKELNKILQDKFDIEFEWILPTSTIETPINYEAVRKYFPEQAGKLQDVVTIWRDFIISKPIIYKNDIEGLFINKLMTVDRINDTLVSWKKYNNLQQRYPILKEALEAHNESNFFLSVSTLTPQVEGVIIDIIREDPDMNENFRSISEIEIGKAIISLEKIWKQKGINNIGKILNESPLSKMLENLYKDDREIPNNDGLYRKGICHGGITNFGTAKNSLNLILILDRLISSFII